LSVATPIPRSSEACCIRKISPQLTLRKQFANLETFADKKKKRF
jgi:hypothetical protein